MSAWSRWPMQLDCWRQKIPGATRRSLRECRVGGPFRPSTSNRTRHQRSAQRPRKVALETHSLRIELGRKSKVTNWKGFYRDDLDQDRTSRSSQSEESALERARELYLGQHVEESNARILRQWRYFQRRAATLERYAPRSWAGERYELHQY